MKLLKISQIGYRVENLEILKDISLSVNQGDCISLIGGSGSGKSTLLKLCSDLISPSSGEMFFAGQPYSSYEPTALRKRISYGVQLPYLFGNTVYDNLSFPFQVRKEKPDIQQMEKWLLRFNLGKEYLNKEVRSLSGGEKQRVALIRNVIYKPELLLLDEATSALDKENEKIIEDNIQKLNQEGVTVLWVTHNLEQSLRIFNKRLTLQGGMIISEEVFEK